MQYCPASPEANGMSSSWGPREENVVFRFRSTALGAIRPDRNGVVHTYIHTTLHAFSILSSRDKNPTVYRLPVRTQDPPSATHAEERPYMSLDAEQMKPLSPPR